MTSADEDVELWNHADLMQENSALDDYASEGNSFDDAILFDSLESWAAIEVIEDNADETTESAYRAESEVLYTPLFPKSSCTTRAHPDICPLTASASPPTALSLLMLFSQPTRASSMP